jgi:AcrR family transcriptional regulator
MRTRDPRKEKAIRDKALAMIVKEGFDGLSMQKLAKSAGVSPATIYIYYKDRDDLILRLYAEASKEMTAFTLEDFDPEMTFSEGLKVQWINRARYCIKHPMEAHFMEQVRFSPLHDRALEFMDPRFMEAMRTFVKGAIKRDEIVRVPVEVYWSVAFAPLYQLVKFHKHGKGMPGTGKFILDEKTMMLTLDLVLKALKP